MLTRQEFKKIEMPLEYTKNRRPDRVHIGLVQLSTDHSLEMDWAKLVGTKAAVFSSRVYYSGALTSKALLEIASGISDAAGLIAVGLPLDVMAFGCTSASMIIGSKKIEELLTAQHPGIPATNPWIASNAAFRRLNIKKIAVFSPYPTEINYTLYRELIAEGFEVPVMGALGIENDTEITMVSFDSMVKGIEQMIGYSSADVIFISCTNLRVLDYIEELESIFGIRVVCSNQAMFWHAMVLAGKVPDCPGYGYLLTKALQ